MSFIINPYAFAAASSNPADPGGASPSDLTGLQLWMKANNSQFNSASDGDEIATWNDASGNSRNCTGVLRQNFKPRWKQTAGPNSYPAVLMHETGGDGGYFTVPNFLNPAGYTAGNVFCVLKCVNDPPPFADQSAPACGGWGSVDDTYYPYVDSKIYDDFGTNSRKDAIVTGGGLTSWHVYEVRTASGAWSNYKGSNTALFSTGTNTVAWGTSPFIARSAGSTKFMKGWVAEIIFYSSVLSSSDRWNTVHTYLNNKYGFSLPTS